jgi:hypothetical protein
MTNVNGMKIWMALVSHDQPERAGYPRRKTMAATGE